jgi:hypothetical protein
MPSVVFILHSIPTSVLQYIAFKVYYIYITRKVYFALNLLPFAEEIFYSYVQNVPTLNIGRQQIILRVCIIFSGFAMQIQGQYLYSTL